MPYGGEESDHDFIRNKGKDFSSTPSTPSTSLNLSQPPSTLKFIYAGAMLPKAYKPLEEIFKALSELHPPSLGLPTSGWLTSSTLQPLQPLQPPQPSAGKLNLPQPLQPLQFHFIGTLGTIKPIAEKHGLFGTTVFEHPDRIPYLDVLTQLEAADAVFILGSTEPHYTPSKVYQGVLSGKPILAVLHEQSTAVNVLRASNAGIVITMKGEEDLDTLSARFLAGLREFENFRKAFDPNKINRAVFEQYSAKAVTVQLVEKLDEIVSSAL
jgi:hypothetical protein